MHSDLPKVLQPLGGIPLLHHVLRTAGSFNPASLSVVFGYGGDQVQASCHEFDINWVYQAEQQGTGHAVRLALRERQLQGHVLIMYGDVPLLPAALLSDLVALPTDIGILTARFSDPTGYGRILRNSQTITGIVEQRDATREQQQITEINTGILCARASLLAELLQRIGDDNDQPEIYLTDIVGLAHNSGYKISSVTTHREMAVSGINDKQQLATMERYLQQQRARHLLDSGVTLMDPARIDIRGSLSCGKNVCIDINCIFQGTVILGDNVSIGPGCIIRDAEIGPSTVIKSHSVIEETVIADRAIIGPFARLRPGTRLSTAVHIGNFVEVKNAVVDTESKVSHLSYIGDSEIGKDVNIGAGTTTCNYDGAEKHRTIIEDNVFIGSGSELVAPIKVGKGATTGAGSTLSKDIAAGDLAVSRPPVKTVRGWKRPGGKR